MFSFKQQTEMTEAANGELQQVPSGSESSASVQGAMCVPGRSAGFCGSSRCNRSL